MAKPKPSKTESGYEKPLLKRQRTERSAPGCIFRGKLRIVWYSSRRQPTNGDGLNGEYIGSVTEDLDGIGGWADFDFSDYQLVEGNRYTIVIEIPSGRGMHRYASGNLYPDGVAYRGDSENPNRDLQFRVLGSPVCTIIEISDGEIEIECPSGETLTVDDFSCTTVDNQDGTYDITCGDGTSVTVMDGQDGSSCTVEDQGDGSSVLSCEDGTSVTVSDGQDGTSCTVEEHDDDSATISCDDGTSFTVASGQDGADGGCSSTNANPANTFALLMLLGGFMAIRRRRA